MRLMAWILLLTCYMMYAVTCAKTKVPLFSRNFIMKFEGTEEEAKEYGETLGLKFRRKVVPVQFRLKLLMQHCLK